MKKNNQGFSLVELAIGLAVITILILGISVSAGIRDNARVQAAANSIQTLRVAAENYLSNGNLSYANLNVTALQTAKLLPANFSAVKTNPWGGDFAIAANAGDNTHFDVVLTSLTQVQADKLASYFNNNATSSAYDASKSSWSVTF